MFRMDSTRKYTILMVIALGIIILPEILNKSPVEAVTPLPPTQAPMNSQIAYVSSWNIFVMDVNGSKSRCLTICDTSAPTNASAAPAWSPNGKYIAFKASRQGSWAFYIMSPTGQQVHKIADYDSCNSDISLDPPTWSPDSRQIAFASCRDKHWSIYLINIDGSGLMQLVDVDSSVGSPSWSPDGQHIVFDTPKGIAIVDIDGSNLKFLTDEGASPAWSPDGNQIAYVSVHDGKWSLKVMDADGSNSRQLVEGKNIVDSPTWSPDRQYIAFMAQPDESLDYYDGNIYRITVDGSNLSQLTDKGGWSPAWSLPLLRSVGVSPVIATDTP